MKTLQEQWEKVERFKVFEIPVIDNRTEENDIILFNISMDDTDFIATHEAFTVGEQISQFIPYCKCELNDDFSLDENLASLYDICLSALEDSEFYNIIEE